MGNKKNNQPWKDAKKRREHEHFVQRVKQNEFIEAKQVPGKGRGIFATTAFKRNDIVCTFTGSLVEDRDTLMERIKEGKVDPVLEDYVITNKLGQVIVPDPNVVGGHLANHSCRPNTQFDHSVSETIALIATRAIAPGDEVTCYYGWIGFKNPPCCCGEEHCHGVIGIRNRLDDGGGIRYEDAVDALCVAARNRNPGILTPLNKLFNERGLDGDTFSAWINLAVLGLDFEDGAWLVSTLTDWLKPKYVPRLREQSAKLGRNVLHINAQRQLQRLNAKLNAKELTLPDGTPLS